MPRKTVRKKNLSQKRGVKHAKKNLTPRQELDALVRERFRPETKAARVRRALAALHQEPAIKPTREEWREIDRELREEGL